jgi:hypothetical protein
MSIKVSGLIFAIFLVGFISIAIIMVPGIFGSIDANKNITDNDTGNQYNATSGAIIGGIGILEVASFLVFIMIFIIVIKYLTV